MSPTPFAAPSGTFRRCLGPLTIAGLFHLLVVVLYLTPFHGDPSALVCASQKEIGKAPFEAVHVGFPTDGFDGQYYYVIARDPFHVQDEQLDLPSLRHARLLYPTLAWMLSAGDPERLLWVMPFLNLVAVLGLTWLGALIALRYGRSAWWGLLLPVAINAVLPGLRNLTDPLAAMSVVGLLAAWLLRWPTWVMIGWGVASVLSREQNIAIVGIVAFESLLDRDRRRFAGTMLVAGIWFAWMVTLWKLHGKLPTTSENVSAPFAGLVHGWTHIGEGPNGPRHFVANLVRLAVLTSQLLVSATILLRGYRTAGLVGLAATGLACIGGVVLYTDSWSYMRVLNWLPLSIWLWTVQSGRRWPTLMLLPAVMWPAIELVKVWR